MKGYIREAERLLDIKESHKVVDSDTIEKHKKLVDRTIDRFNRDKTLNEKVAGGHKIANWRTPKFHTTPKIHKAGNPERHVVCSTNSLTGEKIRNCRHSPTTNCIEIPSYLRYTQRTSSIK